MSLLRPILTTTLRIAPRVRTFLIRNTRLTPCLVSQTRQVTSPSTPGSSDSSTTSAPLPPQQEEQDPRVEMLQATMPFIPQYGWSMESLIHGARSLGYPSVAHGMFPGGEAGLIDAYLAWSREIFVDLVKQKINQGELEGLSMNEKVKLLTALRLEMNKPYIQKWPEALAIMARPSNIAMSLKHLGDIADDIWYYAGDRSPDMNWYARRASLAACYSAAEIFMTQDLSPNYTETERFLERRLDQAVWVGDSTRQLGTMLTFGAKSMMSALANRGGRF